MRYFDSKSNFIYLWIFVIYCTSARPINAAFLDWMWSSGKDNESFKETNGPFVTVPFEYKTEDEKFLEEASKFTDLMKTSSLDICQHKVILKIKTSCFQMSEEELAKMSVNLLNCQSEVDERRVFPCSDSMSLKECTKDMDSDMWNAYHLMNNRARAVCLAARRSQFQALSEMTINKLMSTSHDQINKMTSLLDGQKKLESLTLGTLDSVTKGHDELIKQQENLESSQKVIQDFVTFNLEQLTQEKALIAAGNKALAKMTENIKEKLDEANEQLSNQAEERASNHRKLLRDIEALQVQAQDIFNRIDFSTEKLLAQHEMASLRYKDAVENLVKINDTVHYLLTILNSTRNEIDEKFSWLQDLLYGTGDNIERLASITFHLAYLLLGMLFSSFLNLSATSRALLSIIVPLNLYVTYNNGSDNAMDFSQMTVLLGSAILVIAILSKLLKFRHSNTPRENLTYGEMHPQINGKNESKNTTSKSRFTVGTQYFRRVYYKLSHSLNQLLSFIFGWIGNKSNQSSYQPRKEKRFESTPTDENFISSSFSEARHRNLNRHWSDYSYPNDESAHSRVSEWLQSRMDQSSRPETPSSSKSGSYKAYCSGVCRSGRRCKNVSLPGRSLCHIHITGTSITG